MWPSNSSAYFLILILIFLFKVYSIIILTITTLAVWCGEPTHWERLGCWERLRAGEGGKRGWEGWMASPTQWTWVWANYGRQWRTGKPGVLQSMGSQRVGNDLVTKQQETWNKRVLFFKKLLTGRCCPKRRKIQENSLSKFRLFYWAAYRFSVSLDPNITLPFLLRYDGVLSRQNREQSLCNLLYAMMISV